MVLFTRAALTLAVCAAAFSLSGQTPITITGSVKDANTQTGIAGATVLLAVANKSAQTDASGAYSITGTFTSVLKGSDRLRIQRPSFFEGNLYFGVSDNGAHVVMDAYDLCGRRAARLYDRTLTRENYRVAPFTGSLSSQIYFVKVSVGAGETVLKLPLAAKKTRGSVSEQRLSGGDVLRYCAKTSAAVDTLIASAPGYSAGRAAIDSYTGTYNFNLEKSGFGLASPADKAMVTATHKPTLSWNPSAGAVKYQIWLNISRTDYDWAAPGPLIDRYTKIGETTTATSFATDSLQDRWTYKWYVVAVDNTGKESKSEIRTFGKYLPRLATVDDGIQVINGCRDLSKNGAIEPFEDWRNSPEVRVADLIGRMTLEQKAKQLVYEGYNDPEAGWAYFWPIAVSQIQTDFIKCAKAPWGIPYISAGDQIQGYKVVVPNQAMLAASRDLDITYKCADVFRRCMRAISAYGNLGPLAEINTCVLYWRVQEGCGEDADLAAAQCRAMIAGYHNGPELNPSSYLECLKHWPGQGAGGEGTVRYDWTTIKWHMRSWKAAIEAGVHNIMPGYSSCPLLQTAGRGAGDDPGIIGYLRDSLKYDGIITTDWLPSGAWVNACNAGSDVMGGAAAAAGAAALTGGGVSETRITQACRRVLDVKFRLGMFENPYPPYLNNSEQRWAELRAEGVHVQAAREGLTLLKNNGVLPFSKLARGDNIIVTGPMANSTNCTYVWYSGFNEGTKTFQWCITQRAATNGVGVVSAAPAKAAVVIVGEATYTHSGGGTIPTSYDMTQAQTLKAAGIPVVIVYIMPRQITVSWEAQNADAMVVAYRPGDGGPQALAEFLFGDFKPRGKLPWQLPKTDAQITADKVDLPYDMGATDAQVSEIRALIDQNKPVPAVYGDPQFQWGAGLQSW
jgi:beta-glucosidase-like glycosyl hydrolase